MTKQTKSSSGALAAFTVVIGGLAFLGLSATMIGGCKEDDIPEDAGPDVVDFQAGRVCGDDGGPGDWRVSSFGLTSNSDAGLINFFDIWGVDEFNIWVVGSEGTVLHYDGTSWTPQQTPTTSMLTGVWGTGPNDVWAVGFDGVVIHYDGTSWQDLSPPDTSFVAEVPDAGSPDGGFPRLNLRDVFVAGPVDMASDVFAVGDDGLFLHYEVATMTWTYLRNKATSPVNNVDSQETLYGVWGANANNVFAVGDFGVVLFGDPTGYDVDGTGSIDGLRGIWGRGANNFFVVGLGGAMFQYNGGFNEVQGVPPQVFRGIFGADNDGSKTWAVGWDGVIGRLNGTTSFTSFNCVTTTRLESMWGTWVDDPFDGGYPFDASVPISDAGVPQIFKTWTVGVSETLIEGP